MLDAHPVPAAPARPPAALPAPAIAEPAAPRPEPRSAPAALLAAARILLPVLEAGQALDARSLAEITGRSRRVLRIEDARGERLALRSRPASANLAETAAFMNHEKRILVFSMAGGIGRSYHADLGCANTERRIHYLLEPGWRADQAIQGLGRTHRTHQASAPLFRPVATDVKGERRFIATIARRLDSLGAITRGQRDSQTAMGGDDTALFRASDNLESLYAKSALRQFYIALWRGQIEGWSLKDFEEATGLKLTWEGNLKEDLPPMAERMSGRPAELREGGGELVDVDAVDRGAVEQAADDSGGLVRAHAGDRGNRGGAALDGAAGDPVQHGRSPGWKGAEFRRVLGSPAPTPPARPAPAGRTRGGKRRGDVGKETLRPPGGRGSGQADGLDAAGVVVGRPVDQRANRMGRHVVHRIRRERYVLSREPGVVGRGRDGPRLWRLLARAR